MSGLIVNAAPTTTLELLKCSGDGRGGRLASVFLTLRGDPPTDFLAGEFVRDEFRDASDSSEKDLLA